MDASAAARQAAEQQLAECSRQPGYAAVMAQAATSQQLPPDVRQLAGVLLKTSIKRCWGDAAQLSPAERQAVRDALPAGLSDADSKVRTAVGMAIAQIAKHDFPEHWPGLLDTLQAAVSSRSDANQGEAWVYPSLKRF